MCFWSAFVDKIDDSNRNLLLNIAPYAGEDHNAYLMLECIAEISKEQVGEAYILWQTLLEGSHRDYPEEAVRSSLENFCNKGDEGIRKARDIVSEYLKHGIERPKNILNSVLSDL